MPQSFKDGDEFVLGFLLWYRSNGETEVALAEHKLGPKNIRGRLNGYGGKMNEGETPKIAMLRELKEESGVWASGEDCHLVGVFEGDRGGVRVKINIFFIPSWSPMRDFFDKGEMGPRGWFPASELPWDGMPEGDREMLGEIFETLYCV